ncbi:hypothetical protein HN51_043942 [Arachis hypogaea]|uniref:uncharacterized protein n=1 Tax=Arachis hypogaea TaxID=3818 RepID=UPI003B0D172A
MDSMEFIINHGMQRSNSNSSTNSSNSSDTSSMSRRSRLLTCFKPTATLDDDDMLLSPGGETRRRKSKWQALRKAIKETSLVRTLSNKRKERKERKLRSNSSSSSMSSLSNMSSNDNSSSSSSISTSSSSSPSLNSFSPIQDNNNSKVLTPTLTIKNMRLHNLRTTSLPSNPSNNSSPLLTTSASISSTSSFSSRLGSIFSPHHATTTHSSSPKSPFSPQSVSNRTPFSPQNINAPRTPFSQNHPRTPKQGQIYINYKRECCSYDAYTATYMLLVSLLFLVMWGKTLAIFYTSIWFYVVRPARRRPENNNCQYGRNKSGDYNQLIGLMQYRRKMLKQGSLVQRSDTNLLSMSSSCSMPTHLSSTFNSMRRNSFSGKISC